MAQHRWIADDAGGSEARFEYETLYFGHGQPVFEGASAIVTDVAESQ